MNLGCHGGNRLYLLSHAPALLSVLMVVLALGLPMMMKLLLFMKKKKTILGVVVSGENVGGDGDAVGTS